MERGQEEIDDDDSSAGEAYLDVNNLHSDVLAFEAKAASSTTTEIVKVRLGDSDEFDVDVDDDDGIEEERHEVQQGFRRFVDLLERCPLRSLQSVTFETVNFGSDSWFHQGDVERLYGEALPSLLTSAPLTTLHFESCVLLPTHFAAFLTRISSARAGDSRRVSLRELVIKNCSLRTHDCVLGLAEVIRNNNVPIHILTFIASPTMEKESCQNLFGSLRYSPHLRVLEVGIEQAFEDAPILPLDPSLAALRCLRISVERWTDEGRTSLARQLKTNTTLEELHVSYRVSSTLNDRPWIEMLESHNFTLRTLTEQVFGYGLPIVPGTITPNVSGAVPFLSRNDRIHQALAQFPHYQVTPTALVPLALEMVSSLPTLLYRFLRQGNVNAVIDRLAQQQE